MVKVQEAENQIITHYEVFAERPKDSQLLFPRSNNTSGGLARSTNGSCRRRVLQSKEREDHPRNGSEASRGAESQQQKQRAEKTSENALVPGRTALADRMRRPH